MIFKFDHLGPTPFLFRVKNLIRSLLLRIERVSPAKQDWCNLEVIVFVLLRIADTLDVPKRKYTLNENICSNTAPV